MWLWLYWQAISSPLLKGGGQGAARLSLNDGTNSIFSDFPLMNSVGPLESWQPGQVRRAIYHVPTSPRLTGEKAQVSVALVTAGGEVEAETTLAPIVLETRPRQFEAPTIATATEIAFGNSPQLKLIGYNLATTSLSPGDTLSVTLFWQAVAEMRTDYTIFVQLLNSSGQVAAQIDAPPLAGAAPTTTWLPGEILTDPYTLSLPADLPTGDYHLITGLYNAATAERLPIAGGDNFVVLSQITVK
jgi:hypothetical protein